MVIVGTFLINPLFVYAVRLFSGQAGSGFFRWYPKFFDGMWGFGGNFAPLGQGTHLWYLEYLFIFSLILLPFFLSSKRRIDGGLKRLSNRFEKPWALFILFLPISAVGAGFELIGLGAIRITGGWHPISYLLFFSYGYMIFSNGRILEIVHRYGPMFLVAAIILTALYVDTHFGFDLIIPIITRHDMSADGALRPLHHFGWVSVQALRGLVGWCWIIGLLGTGSRLLNFNNKILSHANEAVLPFCILHHSVILLVGAYVVKWGSGIGTKFFIIAAVSMAIIMAIYELLVRRIYILRFLFGMKWKKVGAAPGWSRGSSRAVSTD
jgi:glucan biosynthesis protein C